MRGRLLDLLPRDIAYLLPETDSRKVGYILTYHT